MNRRDIATGAALGLVAAQFAQPAAAQAPGDILARILGGAITDVPGVKVGHFTDPRRPTGCTVILTEEGAVGGVDVRGAAPGTRETELLDPSNLVERVHAVMLSGGSAFGLEAATGAVRFLEEKGIGFPAGPARVPIVPAAILFDLGMGDHRIRPDAAAGHAACVAASDGAPAEGSVGAGAGATVGKLFGLPRGMKGGIGTASAKVGRITLGAIVAVNAVGDVIDPASGAILAGARNAADGRTRIGAVAAVMRGELPPALQPGMATTIGVIATDAQLTKAQAKRLAGAAHNGLARSITPVHTMWDGDAVFALATGRSGLAGNLMALKIMAAEVMAAAVMRAVLHARAVSGAGVPALPTASVLA
jgi:L-aminopeptidase/D-esterase-like protein